MRIGKFLAHAGLGSRRSVDLLIDEGVVSVNGEVIRDKGRKIDLKRDMVWVRHQRVTLGEAYLYLIVNKPVGVVSTTSDEEGRETVVDLVSKDERYVDEQLWPVGRLDRDSRGLMLLTNDGDLTHRLTHPRWHVDKRYEVKVAGELLPWKLDKLRSGVFLSDGVTSEAEVNVIKGRADVVGSRVHLLEFVLQEGRNRQIRRMCGAVKLEVLDLCRVGIGTVKDSVLLRLNGLEERAFRELSEKEVAQLKKLVDL